MATTSKAIIKLLLFLLAIIIVIPIQSLVLIIFKDKRACIVPRIWNKSVCFIFNIKTKITGVPVTDRQALYVSNHLSYLDIPATGSFLPASFVAKAEVANWPLFGFLGKLNQTAFISRRPKDARKETAAIAKRLKSGHSLILFPEGTSSSGVSVLPFKSSLFSLTLKNNDHAADILIQPFTIELKETNGNPVQTDNDRDLYCWYGDMALIPHLWNFCKNNGATLHFHFHPPRKANDYNDRKKLALACYEDVVKKCSKS